MSNFATNKEIIGAIIEIIDSKNKSLVGVKGKVIDETKNTITLDSGKTILKSHAIFKISNKIIHGSEIAKRSEDRIKK